MPNYWPGSKWMHKPPVGTRLNYDNELLGKAVLLAYFPEGYGARTWDYSPRWLPTFAPDQADGKTVSPTKLGLGTSTANSVFSGWGQGLGGPALLINSADTTFSGGACLGASSVDFKGHAQYWANDAVKVTTICQWFSTDAGSFPMLWGASNRDSSAGAFALYINSATNNLTFGDGVTEWNSTQNAQAAGKWFTGACSHKSNTRLFMVNGKFSTVTGSSTGAGTLLPGDLFQYAGVGWINGGASGVEGGTGWNGFLNYAYSFIDSLTGGEMESVYLNPWQFWAPPRIRSFFTFSSVKRFPFRTIQPRSYDFPE